MLGNRFFISRQFLWNAFLTLISKMNSNRKRARISLAPIQDINDGKRIKDIDYWRVSQENQHLAKRNSRLRMNVRKLMEERLDAGHRAEKAKLVVINLVSRFEEIKSKVEETAEMVNLAKDMEVKLNINGDEDVNHIHNTAFVMNHDPDEEDKENKDPSLTVASSSFGKPVIDQPGKSYIPRIADCSIYGFDD